MLDKDVLKQRIEAARNLRGITQPALQKLFLADGLNEYDAGKIERGEKDMQRVHHDAFCRHLRVPARWFSEKDTDALTGYVEMPEHMSSGEVSAAAALLAPELLGAVQALLKEQEQDAPSKDKPGRPPEDPGGGS